MWNGNGYHAGSHYVECARCSDKVLDDQVTKDGYGYIVCKKCYESRHPQEFVRARKDKIAASGLVQSEVPANYVSGVCNFANSRAIAGIAVAGCFKAGFNPSVPAGTF